MTLLFEVQNPEGFRNIPASVDLERWIQLAWLSKQRAECVLRIVGNEESQQLNQHYRGKNKPTNVLSFSYDAEDWPKLPPEATEIFTYAGDLVLCLPVIEQEAKEQKKTLESHWAHMIIHGLLHLQGFDHIEPEDAEAMEAQEIDLLKQLGFPNPY